MVGPARRRAATPPVRFSFISGGRSNLTYRIDDGSARPLVLRRPPVGGVLETAHDMGREWKIISGLAGVTATIQRQLRRRPRRSGLAAVERQANAALVALGA